MKTISAQTLLMLLILCFTLGLAPFVPEPHIFGKIKWVLGGAKGMQPLDYFDLLIHGTPWLLLIGAIIIKLTQNRK